MAWQRYFAKSQLSPKEEQVLWRKKWWYTLLMIITCVSFFYLEIFSLFIKFWNIIKTCFSFHSSQKIISNTLKGTDRLVWFSSKGLVKLVQERRDTGFFLAVLFFADFLFTGFFLAVLFFADFLFTGFFLAVLFFADFLFKGFFLAVIFF